MYRCVMCEKSDSRFREIPLLIDVDEIFSFYLHFSRAQVDGYFKVINKNIYNVCYINRRKSVVQKIKNVLKKLWAKNCLRVMENFRTS